jgi:hypothetical protein
MRSLTRFVATLVSLSLLSPARAGAAASELATPRLRSFATEALASRLLAFRKLRKSPSTQRVRLSWLTLNRRIFIGGIIPFSARLLGAPEGSPSEMDIRRRANPVSEPAMPEAIPYRYTLADLEAALADLERLPEQLEKARKRFWDVVDSDSDGLMRRFNRGYQHPLYGFIRAADDGLFAADPPTTKRMLRLLFVARAITARVGLYDSGLMAALKALETLAQAVDSRSARVQDIRSKLQIDTIAVGARDTLSRREYGALSERLSKAQLAAESARQKVFADIPVLSLGKSRRVAEQESGLSFTTTLTLERDPISRAPMPQGPPAKVTLLRFETRAGLATAVSITSLGVNPLTNHHDFVEEIHRVEPEKTTSNVRWLRRRVTVDLKTGHHLLSRKYHDRRFDMTVRRAIEKSQKEYLWRHQPASGTPRPSLDDATKAIERVRFAQQALENAMETFQAELNRRIQENDRRAKEAGRSAPDSVLTYLPPATLRVTLYAARAKAVGDPAVLALLDMVDKAAQRLGESIKAGENVLSYFNPIPDYQLPLGTWDAFEEKQDDFVGRMEAARRLLAKAKEIQPPLLPLGKPTVVVQPEGVSQVLVVMTYLGEHRKGEKDGQFFQDMWHRTKGRGLVKGEPSVDRASDNVVADARGNHRVVWEVGRQTMRGLGSITSIYTDTVEDEPRGHKIPEHFESTRFQMFRHLFGRWMLLPFGWDFTSNSSGTWQETLLTAASAITLVSWLISMTRRAPHAPSKSTRLLVLSA